ncbi:MULTISPECIES: CaiB/BaiF CoA transferase family protein [Streptomyces]|uniref:CaiB/BaiF CoA transferase family protein n=1 Tax=Streptomyces TaxID=1883 RepID=UPI0004DB1118|nr:MULTISPECIES: CaiB/BaiF CoA-transferase family protein [Streptomyces]
MTEALPGAVSGAGPLAGLRVVELAGIGPAPYACLLLAEMGAAVVRVDRPGGGRSFAEWHRLLDRGRHRTLELDLKTPEGAARLLREAAGADVLVEGFRPGVAERLGIGPGPCQARNPGLVYARMTGWGQDGPLAGTAGHDINYLALSGALHAVGEEGGPPVPPLNLLGDFAGGSMFLVAGVLAALYERRRTGRGRIVDAAVVDGAGSMLGMLVAMAGAGQWRYERGVNLLDGGAPFYRCYACADGRHLAVGALEEPFYRALLDGLGLDGRHLPDRWDRDSWPALRQRFAAAFARRDRDAWAARFAGTDACVTPVLTAAEAADHPHHRARRSGPATPAPRFRDPAAAPAAPPAGPVPPFEAGSRTAPAGRRTVTGRSRTPATTPPK